MKIAICCFYEAYPPISGAAAVSFNIAKFLPGETLLIQTGSLSGLKELPGLRVISVRGASQSGVGRIGSLSRCIRAIVHELIRFRPDIVILEGASWAVYHWMLLRAIRCSLTRLRVVYHSHNVEYEIRRQRHGRAVAAVTRWAEARLLAHCDMATAVSEVDRTLFRELYGVDTVLLPNGVDVSRFTTVTASEVEGVRNKYGIGNAAIIFSGLYSYPPNRTAIDFLLSKVMPHLLVNVPNAQLVITGGQLPKSERWLVSTGIVPYDEMPALLSSCRVATAPIFSGSGTRIKILEAMAAGVPVVATSKGAEGLQFRDNEHLFVANDATEFVASLRHLIGDRAIRDRFRATARDAVRDFFDWKAIASRFASHIDASRDHL